MTCVKPFTIPDKWTENQTAPWDPTDGFSRYDKKGNVIPNADVYVPAFNGSGQANAGYTGYNNEANRGVRLVLRSGQGTQIQSSFYFSLAMTGDTGGDDYRWNIANCNHSIYHWGDALTQEPGAALRAFARSRSTSTRRRIFPEGDFGICSIISSRRTRLVAAVPEFATRIPFSPQKNGTCLWPDRITSMSSCVRTARRSPASVMMFRSRPVPGIDTRW